MVIDGYVSVREKPNRAGYGNRWVCFRPQGEHHVDDGEQSDLCA